MISRMIELLLAPGLELAIGGCQKADVTGGSAEQPLWRELLSAIRRCSDYQSG